MRSAIRDTSTSMNPRFIGLNHSAWAQRQRSRSDCLLSLHRQLLRCSRSDKLVRNTKQAKCVESEKLQPSVSFFQCDRALKIRDRMPLKFLRTLRSKIHCTNFSRTLRLEPGMVGKKAQTLRPAYSYFFCHI